MWGGPFLNFPRNLSHFINIFAHICEFVDTLIIIIVFSEQFIEIYMYIMTICIEYSSIDSHILLNKQYVITHQDVVEIYIAPTFHIILQSL